MPCGNRLADLGFTEDSIVGFVREWYADGGTISEMALFIPGMPESEIADICFGRERPRKSPKPRKSPAGRRRKTGGRPQVPVLVDGRRSESIQKGAASNGLRPKSLMASLSAGRTELCGRTIAFADPERERERLAQGREWQEREKRRQAEKRAESRRTGGPPGRRGRIAIPVRIDGAVHPGAKAGAEAIGLNPSTLRHALWQGKRSLKGHSIALADGERERLRLRRAEERGTPGKRTGHPGTAVLIGGTEHRSVSAGARAEGIKPMTLASALHRGSRMCRGRSIAYADPERERERLERAEAERAKRTRPWKSAVIIDSVEHGSVAEGSRAVGVTRTSLMAALSRGSRTTGGHSIAYADPERERARLETAARGASPVPHPRLCEWTGRPDAEREAELST